MPIKKSRWLEHGAVEQPIFRIRITPGRDALVSDSPAKNHMAGSHKRREPRSLLGAIWSIRKAGYWYEGQSSKNKTQECTREQRVTNEMLRMVDVLPGRRLVSCPSFQSCSPWRKYTVYIIHRT